MVQKPSYLTGGSGAAGHLSAKRGTEDLDYFIGDEAIAQASGPGTATFCPFAGSPDEAEGGVGDYFALMGATVDGVLTVLC